MDAEAHLSHLDAAAAAFDKVSAARGPNDPVLQRISRLLSGVDPMERLIPEKLLYETVETALRGRSFPASPLIVFMNRGGHGDGARSAAGLTALLKKRLKKPALLHVSFNTPHGGLGALVRGAVEKLALDHEIEVRVSLHNLPAERLAVDAREADAMLGAADLVISYAASGASGIVPKQRISAPDPLLARSHVSVLSFPDPEGLPGELPRFENLVAREPNLTGLRFWVQIENGGRTEEFGVATLSRTEESDAPARLWQLIENARRRPYRVLVEPLSDDAVSGYPLVCPCRSLLKEPGVLPSVRVEKIVPIGTISAVTAVGVETDA